MNINSIQILFLLIGVSFNLSAQKVNFWSQFRAKNAKIDIRTRTASHYNLDLAGLKQSLSQGISGQSIQVPLPDGSFETFVIEPSRVMSPRLAAKYPEILTFNGRSSHRKEARFDITPKGFHAMIFSNEGTIFIDPINQTSKDLYQCYFKKDYLQKEVSFLEDDVYEQEGAKVITTQKATARSRASGVQLRKYRLAVTATGEYTQFHGGTVADAMAAIVTTMNRVNGIYEREVSITMMLVDNNNKIIYTDPDTDPYSNGNARTLIEQVQGNIDEVIGNANYDIGHGLFKSNDQSGLARNSSVCQTGMKALGVSGVSSLGDPFVGFVAHETGHQFGAEHTFNSCRNRNAPTAYEPGSGTTIMSYAGVCSSQNIQSNTDPYFHTTSYEQIINFSVHGAGAGCATIISTGNHAPAVDAGEGGFVIPANTPFTLTGSGSDPDRDELTYSWEQFDLGYKGAPNSPKGNAPLFRSFPPKDTPSRTFPDISDIINNRQTLGELLPSYTRDMTFRLTARDNRDGGGGVNYDQMEFKVTDKAGPFCLLSFNTTETIIAQSNVTIHWDVSNTNGSEVNCRLVNILLSGDGGLTYPHLLAGSVINNGSATVLIPDMITSNGRFKVEATDNIFFDINDTDLNIVAPSIPDFRIDLSEQFLSTGCAPFTGQVDVNISSILSFSDKVTLSVDGLGDHLTASFSVNPVMPGTSSSLTISGTGLGVGGLHTLTVNATARATTHAHNLVLEAHANVVEVLNPSNKMTEVVLLPTIHWSGIGGDDTYDLDIATDADFSNIVISKRGLTNTAYQTTALSGGTRYFLRIRGINACSTTDYTSVEFTTGVFPCRTFTSTDTPVTITRFPPSVITSEVRIQRTGVVSDVNILNLEGIHSFVSDLTFLLKSPEGTSVTLLDRICGRSQDFHLGLDNEAGTGAIPCPPTDGGIYSTKERLSVFNGEEAAGIWELTIKDNYPRAGGQLTRWALEICASYSDLPEASLPDPPSKLSLVEVSKAQINLSWKDNSTNEDAFIVERSTAGNSNYIEIATLMAGSTSYEDTDVPKANTYYYRVRASGISGRSGYSNEVFIVQRPESPSELSLVEVSNTQINLFWKDNSTNEDAFIVERSTADNSNYIEIATLMAGSTSYEDINIAPEVYFYRIKAMNSGGDSDYSNEVSGSLVLDTPPESPSELSLVEVSNTQINLFWRDNSTNEDAFIVERSTSDNSNYAEIATLGAGSTSYEDINIAPEVYFYRIKAMNSGGDSDYSNEVSGSLVLDTPLQADTEIVIHPNPGEGLFNLVLPQNMSNFKLSLYDLTGNKIDPVISKKDGNISINLIPYANGIYLLKVSGSHIIRIIKNY